MRGRSLNNERGVLGTMRGGHWNNEGGVIGTMEGVIVLLIKKINKPWGGVIALMKESLC